MDPLNRIRKLEAFANRQMMAPAGGADQSWTTPNTGSVLIDVPPTLAVITIKIRTADPNSNGGRDSHGYYDGIITSALVGPATNVSTLVRVDKDRGPWTDGQVLIGYSKRMTSGSSDSADDGFMLYGPASAQQLILGKTSGAISKGTSGNVKVYTGGSRSDALQLLKSDQAVWNMDADVPDNSWVQIGVIDGIPYLVAAECTA